MSDVSINTLGAAGDAMTVFDVSTTNGSGVVTSVSNPWVVGDVGKVCWVTHSGGAVHALGTIAGYTSAGQVTLSTSATGSITNGQMVWGTTNDTSYFTTAFTTASAGTGSVYPIGRLNTPAARVTMDAGGYIVSGRIYNTSATGTVPSLIGAGKNKSVIFVAPGINTSPGGGGFLIQGSGYDAEIAGFTVDCCNALFSSSNDLVRFVNANGLYVHDIGIMNVGIDTVGTGIFVVASSTYDKIERIFIQGGPGGDRAYGAKFSIHYGVQDVFVSNHYRNVEWGSGIGRDANSGPSYWLGGGVDECGDPLNQSFVVLADSGINIQNAVIFGRLAIGEDAICYITNSNVGKYISPDPGPAFTIASGGKMVASMTTFRNVAGGRSTNNGTIVDAGGNDIADYTNNVRTDSSWADGVSGNQPVSQ